MPDRNGNLSANLRTLVATAAAALLLLIGAEAVSAKGAPDCKLGADKLCRSKGFKEGKSLTTDSAERCSAKVLIPGRTRKPDDCRSDNYVTRAMCQ